MNTQVPNSKVGTFIRSAKVSYLLDLEFMCCRGCKTIPINTQISRGRQFEAVIGSKKCDDLIAPIPSLPYYKRIAPSDRRGWCSVDLDWTNSSCVGCGRYQTMEVILQLTSQSIGRHDKLYRNIGVQQVLNQTNNVLLDNSSIEKHAIYLALPYIIIFLTHLIKPRECKLRSLCLIAAWGVASPISLAFFGVKRRPDLLL